jgi:thiamine biosynthesis lipoprotein ApbE
MAVVLAPVTTQARALALALLVSGKEGAGPILEAFPRCEVLLIPEGAPQEAWMTDGFRLQFALTTGYTTKVIERGATVPAATAP